MRHSQDRPTTILAYTSPALGNLYPIVALLTELRRRGHRIVLRTLTAGVPIGTAAGLDTAAVDPGIEAVAMTDWTARTGLGALRRGFEVFAERAALEVEDVRRAIEAVSPDAVILDTNCWGAPVATEAAALPWATFWPYPPYLSSRTSPPFGPGLAPRSGVLGRWRDAAVGAMTRRLLEREMLEPVNRLHRLLGTTPLTSGDDFVLRAPLVLVGTAEPFEYPHPDWDERVVLIGPCEHRSAGPPTEVFPGPTVLVTTSSERQGDDALPVTALAALADEPVRVVATFPCGVPAGVDVPANATVRRFVDHGAVLDHAVCAITHGGMGVTQKALARGVPVCVVPYGRDQFEVARRVQVAGCGSRLSAHRLNPSRLRAAVAEAMAMRAGAERVAAGFAAAGGVRRGADLVERRLLDVTAAEG
ncbi:glycosyltransferase [Mycolicibacterium sp. Y3]